MSCNLDYIFIKNYYFKPTNFFLILKQIFIEFIKQIIKIFIKRKIKYKLFF
jgi:hypothetical protein